MEEKIVNIKPVDPVFFQSQNYSVADRDLLSSFTSTTTFNPNEDYIEYFVLDLNKKVLSGNVYGFPNYRIIDDNVVVDPQKDLESFSYTGGKYYTVYNFLKLKLNSSPSRTFYIQEISIDRTELRLNTTTIPNEDIVNLTQEFENQINTSVQRSYIDFYLNFGNNVRIIAINIALDNTNPGDPTVLIKLYEPLPSEFTYNTQCWVVEQVARTIAYQIEITNVFNFEDQFNYLQGPNFNLSIQDQINNSTPYYNQTSLQQNISTFGSSSLLYQINSLLAEKGIEISIDYSKYSDFIHFSSAQTRLENFYYKLSLIEQYTANSNISPLTSNPYISASQNIWNDKINEIITNFDGYEYYLYYSSESYAWPKLNSTPPYSNYPTTSSIVLTWLENQSFSASYFDSENKDALVNAVPDYLRDDPENDSYSLFVQMVGQHFDNIWIYLKDISNKFDADNRLDFGISKDIVAQAIRDLGLKIYQNNFSTGDLYSALLGYTISGSNLNIPNITGSLPVPSGSGLEYINTVITASSPNALEPLDDINKEIYKRIYHNLPILLKKKGTPEGLQLLLNIYGVPETILRINEFGGKITRLTNDWDNFVDQFNYEYFTTSSGYVEVPLLIASGSGSGSFNEITSSFSIEFRFKTTGIPTDPNAYNQIIAYAPENDLLLALEYTGSGYISGSYSGSIPDPYNTWGTLKFIELSSGASSSLYLPFFNGNWWSVMYNFNDEFNWILETGFWDDNGIWISTENWLD
jgi:hypothetical protein